MDDATANDILRDVWAGNVVSAQKKIGNAPAGPRASFLKGNAAMLLAALSGDKAASGRAVAALRECSDACTQATAPETWKGWAASWVFTPEPTEATAIRAVAELMLAVAHGMNNEYLAAPLALRKSLGLFGQLPTDGALAPVRTFGAGLFSLLLALLPRPVARLLTLTGGVSEEALFGPGGPSESGAEALLTSAAAHLEHAEAGFTLGVGWLALIVLLLHRSSRVGKPTTTTDPSPTPHDTPRGTAEDTNMVAGLAQLTADVDALETALPNSLVFAWLQGSVLRRVGKLDVAAERLDFVSRRATDLGLDVALYRVAYNRAQCLFGTLEYGRALEVLDGLDGLLHSRQLLGHAAEHLGRLLARGGRRRKHGPDAGEPEVRRYDQ